MKIFTSTQIKELDKYTIEKEPISSIDLMERAAKALTGAICEKWGNSTPVIVFAGPGNNGGDGLAVARMLSERGYKVNVFLFNSRGKLSPDCAENKRRVVETKTIKDFQEVTNEFEPPKLEHGMIVIDALFGSGLNKPLTGGFSSLVKYINKSNATVVSIDVPSGLMTEDNTYNVRANIIKADLTLTLQTKKLAFFFAENQEFLGKVKVLDIQLSKEGIEKIPSSYRILEKTEIRNFMLHRDDFAHKGNMGHALIVAGSYGMAGAAILSATACLRSGVGKLTVHTPKKNVGILQVAIPEAIVSIDKDENYITEAIDTSKYNAIGIGPGLGHQEHSSIALISQIRRSNLPIVLDADALNILSSHRAWVQQLPKDVILTPHPREFDRLSGSNFSDTYERLTAAQNMAQQFKAYIIIKGHYSALCLPDGDVVLNPTGNSGMATAGSGDVLTGIITAFLARGYSQGNACMLGMYIHGLAGDLAAERLGAESLIASDIVNFLPKAFKLLSD